MYQLNIKDIWPMVKNVKVIATDTDEVLFETDMDHLDEAYNYASKMDKMGIDVRVDSPTVTESLVNSLGLNFDQKYKFDKSVEDELNDHEGSCCTKDED